MNRIYINNKIDVAELDGDKVMMNMEVGKYFGLNSVGSYIWDALKTPKTFDELIEELLQRFDVEREVCIKQVDGFIKKLEKCELISLR